MKVGVVMLVHNAFDRAEQVIRHWSQAGCPVVIHVDKNVKTTAYDTLVKSVADLPDVLFSKRHRCEWGMWGIVAASQSASNLMLDEFSAVRHVYLTSGSCLPLRPIKDLQFYLEKRPRTDFIESATTADVPWTKGGLDFERFTLRFPFSWRKNRFLFNYYVDLQRRLKMCRRVPDGIVPHMGSQWWCLTRKTLSAILTDPNRVIYDKYFKRVWIPDESYFQTLVRIYSQSIESRSLTLSKFDYQGKPHVFYDDHLQLLRRSDCFVARKAWPHANKLYDNLLNEKNLIKGAEPNPGKIDRIFSKAAERRTRGRAGLTMQSRLPQPGHENGFTSASYSVFEGFAELFEDFEPWLAQMTGTRVHGHLYAKDRVEFEGRQKTFSGALSDSATLRDHHAQSFLLNLIWNTRGERQCFQFGPMSNQLVSWDLAKDPNAQISVISGAWAIPLFHSNRNFSNIRMDVAKFQRIESEHLSVLRSVWVKARIRIWTLADFIDEPMDALQTVLDEMGAKNLRRIREVPKIVDLTGFGRFLKDLKNQGLNPYLMGDFPNDTGPTAHRRSRRKRYWV
ncbi:MAG: hypothetical protein ACI901_000995 [Octadecabacter sp.]|jgi:hypothetical protein